MYARNQEAFLEQNYLKHFVELASCQGLILLLDTEPDLNFFGLNTTVGFYKALGFLTLFSVKETK